MHVWKRRLTVLVAVAAGSAGLMMSTASAQTPPDFPEIPGFTLPSFPPFPTVPTSIPSTTSPPPTMPPPTTTTTGPPPTMPPSTFPTITVPTPPTMPPTTLDVDDQLRDFFDDLFTQLEEGSEIFDDLRRTVEEILAEF